MANEFKIKTGLLLGPSPTQPVISIKNASTAIVSDASSILLTGKAVYDYVNPIFGKNAAQDASIMRIDASLNNAIEGGSVYIKNSSLGTDFYWAAGYLEVSVGSGGSLTLAGLTDVSIVDLSTNQFLRYDYATGKWKNVSPVEASLYFWPLSTALLREASIGTGLYWSGGLLNASTGGGDVTKLYVDGSLATRDLKIDQHDASIIRIDSSINRLFSQDITINASFGNYVPNASLGTDFYWQSGLLEVSTGAGGAGLSIKETSSNYTALPNYIILANSSWNTIDVTLPTSPANGDIVQVIDINKCSSINNINILRNTHKIDMSTNNFTLDVNGGSIELIYHSLNDNFAILNLEILENFTSPAQTQDKINQLDASLNALYAIVLDTSILEIGAPTVDGSWRLIIDISGNLSVQKRITGSWVEKGNFN